MRQKLGLRIEIRVKSKDRGQVVLSFENNDDFDALLEVAYGIESSLDRPLNWSR